MGDDYKIFLKESTPSTIEGCIRQSMDLKLTEQKSIPYQELVYVLALAQDTVDTRTSKVPHQYGKILWHEEMENSINIVRDYFFPEKTEDE